jgi:hypothetical protein
MTNNNIATSQSNFQKNWKMWDAFQIGRFIQSNPTEIKIGKHTFEYIKCYVNEHGTPMVELKSKAGNQYFRYLFEC